MPPDLLEGTPLRITSRYRLLAWALLLAGCLAALLLVRDSAEPVPTLRVALTERFGPLAEQATATGTGQRVLEWPLGVRNQGAGAFDVIAARAGGLRLSGRVNVRPGEEAEVRMRQLVDCGERPALDQDPDFVTLTVKDALGQVRSVRLRHAYKPSYLASVARYICGFVEPASAITVRAASWSVAGSTGSLELLVMNSGREPVELLAVTSQVGWSVGLPSQDQPVTSLELPPARSADTASTTAVTLTITRACDGFVASSKADTRQDNVSFRVASALYPEPAELQVQVFEDVSPSPLAGFRAC